MDWQSILAIGVAVLCGLWTLQRFVQPFAAKNAGCNACGTGANCNGGEHNYISIEAPKNQRKCIGQKDSTHLT